MTSICPRCRCPGIWPAGYPERGAGGHDPTLGCPIVPGQGQPHPRRCRTGRARCGPAAGPGPQRCGRADRGADCSASGGLRRSGSDGTGPRRSAPRPGRCPWPRSVCLGGARGSRRSRTPRAVGTRCSSHRVNSVRLTVREDPRARLSTGWYTAQRCDVPHCLGPVPGFFR